MSKKAAFRWDSSNKQISFAILDDTTCRFSSGPIVRNADTNALVSAVVQEFLKILQTPTFKDGIVEYRIVNVGSPVAQKYGRSYTPNALSDFVESEFKQFVGASQSWTLARQFQSELSGQHLKKFKAGLKNLGLWIPISGNAYEHHLWALALHSSNSKIGLRVLWRFNEQIANRTKELKKRFEAWYQSLPV
jgi:hypothetical protein